MSHGSSSSSSFVIRVPVRASPRASRARERRRVSAWTSSPSSSWTPPETSETAITVAPRVDELVRRDPADVAEALDDAALLGEVPAEPLARAGDHHHDAGAGRLVPEDGAADRDRLAGHDLRHRVADLHRVRVHHPRHRLLVRRHVRRGDVLLRADDRQQLGGEAARQALELACDSSRGLQRTPPFAPPYGQAQERALPRHPDRERRALAERDLRVVADAALRRAEHGRVLDAVAGEDDAAAVVHPDRDGEHDRALGVAEPLGDGVGDVRVRQRLLELRDRRPEERRVPLEVRPCAAASSILATAGSVRSALVLHAGGGSRTRTAARPADFKSAASAGSATPAAEAQVPGCNWSGSEALRPLVAVLVEEGRERVLVELRAARRASRGRPSVALLPRVGRRPGAERDLVLRRGGSGATSIPFGSSW